MNPTWQPYRESLRTTLVRTILIAIAAGTVFAAWSARGGRSLRWPVAVVLMLWPSFGGHWLEVWFLNWLRPRLPAARTMQAVARVGTWFLDGYGFGIGMVLTARALSGFTFTQWPAWWFAGVVFLGVELVAHTALQVRGRPSFFNGRG